MKTVSKFLLLLSVSVLIAGCKLAVIVVEGGEVQSIGSGTCLGGTICVHQVNDTDYTETFTAVPNSGWAFERWHSGAGFYCQGSADPTCVISGKGTENEAIEAVVESDKTFYLMPVFVKAQPITDTITVDGKEWAQVDLFDNLSWDQINAVCPAGSCVDSGRLNGYDMTGWTWASADDVNALFNYYIGSDVLGPGPDSYYEFDSEWLPAFFGDGWRSLSVPWYPNSDSALQGWLRHLAPEDNAYVGVIEITFGEFGDREEDRADTSGIDEHYHEWDYRGAWFYRTP